MEGGGSREGEWASALLHGSVQTSPPALEIRESFPDLETCLLFSESWLWVFFFNSSGLVLSGMVCSEVRQECPAVKQNDLSC